MTPRSWRTRLRSAVPALVCALGLLAALVACSEPHGPSVSTPSEHGPEAIDHYTCSMHPSVHRAEPGKCPICGMDLIPVTRAEYEQGVVTIDEVRRQLIGVRLGVVIEAPREQVLHAVGRVTYDESKLTDVTLRVHGWITRLFVNQTGQHVQAGQALFQLYSPELYSAEQDFLLATHGADTPAPPDSAASRARLLARSARQRLHLLGLSDGDIQTLSQQGVPSESISIPSPASGYVLEKAVVEGAALDAGARAYRIAGLNSVWVEAEIYEADLPLVHVGEPVNVRLDYVPDRTYQAKISYLYPSVDPMSRTGKLRIELANPELELRPGMYATVDIVSKSEPRVQVPASAVVYTGPRRLVFVDEGKGRFRPQEIRVGSEANGTYEVLEGLVPGERVATSGVFLIAAEARISTAAKYWERAPSEASP
jgi:Cu(I)/Ag(I) efflux system membrane fusion protein